MRTSTWNMALAALTLTAPLITGAQGKPQGGGGMAPPFAGGAGRKPMTLEEAVKVAPQQDKSLAPLAKSYSAAEAKLKKSPKDAAAKKAFVEAAYKFGHAAEYGELLSPPVRYRAALAMYRKALAVNPKHEPSLTEKQKIEEIYKGMNMPIPTK